MISAARGEIPPLDTYLKASCKPVGPFLIPTFIIALLSRPFISKSKTAGSHHSSHSYLSSTTTHFNAPSQPQSLLNSVQSYMNVCMFVSTPLRSLLECAQPYFFGINIRTVSVYNQSLQSLRSRANFCKAITATQAYNSIDI